MTVTIGSRTLLALTCVKCGHLRQGSDFFSKSRTPRASRRYGYCRHCRVLISSNANKRRRNEVRGRALRNGQPWGSEEVKNMYALIDEGLSHAEVAMELQRPVQGIEHAIERYPRSR